MPNLNCGESSRKREHSPNPSADTQDAPERDGKRAKFGKSKNQRRLENLAKLSPAERLAKKEKKKARREKRRALKAQSAPAAQAKGGKSTKKKESAHVVPMGKKTSTRKNQQQLSQDPVERVKQQVAKDLRRLTNKIKNPIIHTGIEMAASHAPHKLKSEGYVFVPAGSKYITFHCKRLTLQSGRNVWKIDHPKGRGVQVPKDIYETVIANEETTRAQRDAMVAKVDKKENDEALKCLLKLFPRLPPGISEEILKRAWQKSSGRVGRTKKLTMEQKVRLAVVAHVRHCHTSYEQRLREEARKTGGQRAPVNVVKKIKSQIWGEVNAVVKSWQQASAPVTQTTQSNVSGKMTLRKNAHKGPASPKTRWQQNVEQGSTVTHPPIKRPQPIFIRHEEREKLEGEAPRKTESIANKKKKLEVIIIESSDGEEDVGVDIPKVVDLNDELWEDDEIMEGNPEDWDAAIGNAQDWDIGEDDEGSDIDENLCFYSDEDDEDYERDSVSDTYEEDYEEETCSDHDMDVQITRGRYEEEDGGDDDDDDDEEVMAKSEEVVEAEEVPLAREKKTKAAPIKRENDETVSLPTRFTIIAEADKSPGEAALEANHEVTSEKVLSELEEIKIKEETEETVPEVGPTCSTVPDDKDPIKIPELEDAAAGSPDKIPLGLGDIEVKKEADTTVFEPAEVESTVLEGESSVKGPYMEGTLVDNGDEIPLGLGLDLEGIKAVKEEDEIMTDPIAQIDAQPYQSSGVTESKSEILKAKQSAEEKDSIMYAFEKEAGLSKEEGEKALRSAVEADEDEIYYDFGF